jgi:uncharacterized protein YbcI
MSSPPADEASHKPPPMRRSVVLGALVSDQHSPRRSRSRRDGGLNQTVNGVVHAVGGCGHQRRLSMTSQLNGRATGPELSAITVAMVKLHRRFYGKGPTEAKTYAINDTILCMLRGGFTTVEQTLMADGKRDDVERIRRSFQDTMKHRFVEVIESTLERPVIGYMSQIHADPDVAIELFLLEPREEKLLGEHVLKLTDENI